MLVASAWSFDYLVDEDRLKRHDLSDEEWARLEPLLPRHSRQGHRWNDHRTVINGIFFRTRTGCPWRDLPERFGNWKTVYNDLKRRSTFFTDVRNWPPAVRGRILLSLVGVEVRAGQ